MQRSQKSDSPDFGDTNLRLDLQASASEGRPISSDVRQFFEYKFSRPLNDVRVIANEHSAAIADRIDARAFTLGRYIWFGRNEYRPAHPDGRRLLAHELVHTVQQGFRGQLLQKNLVIGQGTDPAESEADRFADAVLDGGKAPTIHQRDGLLRREARQACTVSSASRPNQRNVVCGNQTYRATVEIVSSREPETRTSSDLGWNDTAVWLDIEVCRGGTAVNIRPSINLPQALVGILGNLLRGSDALEGVTFSPELRITIVQSNSYSISLSGGPVVDPGSREVTGGRGEISADTSVGRFGLGVEAGQGGRVVFPFRVTPGDFRPETRDCSRQRRRLRLRCERITVRPAVAPTPARYGTLRREVYLLFPYAKSTPIEHTLLRTGSDRPRPVGISEIRALGEQGYTIQSIEGFASPEGPRPASRRRRFVGNQQLSQNRADEAQRWIAANCPTCEGLTTSPVGRSELFSPGQTPEVEGRPLTEYATREFRQSTDPLGPRTEAERSALAQEPLQTQRDSIYRLLRRAVIVFERRVVEQPARPGSPRREIPEGVTCPREVREAIRRHFGISII